MADYESKTKKLIEQGKQKGKISSQDILNEFDEQQELTPEKFEKLCILLKAAGVEIDDSIENFQHDANDVSSYDNVKLYFRDISQYPLLSPEEENRLAVRVAHGEKSAEDQLITANLRLVVKIAKDYMGRGVEFPDLIQEGNLGVIKAAKKFDPEKGNRFSTYATYWIRQAIINAIEENSPLPKSVQKKIIIIKKAMSALSQNNGKEPTTFDIAKKTRIPEKEVAEILIMMSSPISFETPVDNNDDHNFGDIMPDNNTQTPEEEYEEKQNQAQRNKIHKELKSIINNLNSQSREVIKMLFGMEYDKSYSAEEVAKILNLSIEEVKEDQRHTLTYLRSIGYKLTDNEESEKSKNNNVSASQTKTEKNDFVDFRYAIENNISDQDSPSDFVELVSWIAQAKKPIIASRKRIIAFGFTNKLSSDEVNGYLKDFSFGSLYPRSLQDSTLTFCLDLGMSAKEWLSLYKKYAKEFKTISKRLIPEAKLGSKDLSKRDFYKYIVESFSLLSKSEIDNISVDILDSIQSDNNRKKCVKSILKLLNDNKSKSSKILRFLPDSNDTECIAEKICISIFNIDTDTKKINNEIRDVLKDYFDQKTAISSMYKKVFDILEEYYIRTDRIYLVLTNIVLTNNNIRREQIDDILEEFVSEIKSTVSKFICNEVSVYSIISKHLVFFDNEIKDLFSKLQGNASSALTLEALNQYIQKATNENHTIDYSALYNELHGLFVESFSLLDLFQIVQRYSEPENPEMLLTINYTKEKVAPYLQSVTKKAQNILAEQIAQHFQYSFDDENEYKGFLKRFKEECYLDTYFEIEQQQSWNKYSSSENDKIKFLRKNKSEIKRILMIEKPRIYESAYREFFHEFIAHFSETRYLKRRYLYKWLYYCLKKRIDNFVNIQENIIAINEKNASGIDEKMVADRKVNRNQYIKSAEETLIVGLKSQCTGNNDDPNTGSGKNTEGKEKYAYRKLRRDNMLSFSDLAKQRITMSNLFFDFSSFLGFTNNVNKSFIHQFNVSVYFNGVALAKGYAVVTVALKKGSMAFSYHKEAYMDFYQLNNLSPN